MTQEISRRLFLGGSAAALGYFFTAPKYSAVRAADRPNGKIHVAGIGVGGKGSSDIEQAGNITDVIALCDIDEGHLAPNMAKWSDARKTWWNNAKKYHDFRKMLDEMGKDIDAVTVSTPDHTHAHAAVMAMRMKKHVYCQKPLTHSVFEARLMRETAKKYGVCTQMGNQGTAENGLRRAVELIQSGVLGKVTEVHVWTNRPIWPQASEALMNIPSVRQAALAALYKKDPGPLTYPEAPKHVHWDLFVGPAKERPYTPNIHPFSWRGWWDYGTGALGDMACHTANMAFMALKLKYPTHVEAKDVIDLNPETYPAQAQVTWKFPARGDDMPALTFYWYEGQYRGKKKTPPEALQAKVLKTGEKLVDSGSILVGDKGILYSPNDYGAAFRLVGVEADNTTKPEKLPTNGKGDQGQKNEWVEAIKAGKPEVALSNFDYAGLLTEAMLLGNVAIRTGKKLEWDGEQMKFTNDEAANKLIKTEYRKGWELATES